MFSKLKFSFLFILSIWILALINLWYNVNQYGIIPRDTDGLIGIVLSPFLHANIYDNPLHIINNTIFLAFLLPLTLIFYEKIAYRVFIFIIIVGGLLVWIFARASNHIGASTLIFGLLSFLFFGSIIKRNIKAFLATLAVFISYSVIIYGFVPSDRTEFVSVFNSIVDTFLKGVDPRQSYVSWEGHLFGAFSGVLAALFLDEKKKKSS